MLVKRSASPRQPARDCLARPELEALEDRLPPSSVHGNNHGNNDHNNIHITNSFNTATNTYNTITNSFNGASNSFNSALGGQNLGLLSFPQSKLQNFFTVLYKQAASINAGAANALVADEAQLAIDAFLSLEGQSGLSSSINSLQSAIAANTLENSAVGTLLGEVAFDVVLQALTSSPSAS
jgi:hypothetical protein